MVDQPQTAAELRAEMERLRRRLAELEPELETEDSRPAPAGGGSLEESARRFVDLAGVMLVSLDADGRITLVNQTACEVLGCSRVEALGASWFDTFIREQDRETVRAVFDRIMAGELEPVEYFENPVVSGSGEERLIAWHNTYVRDESGRITGTLSSGLDVTQQRTAEAELEQERDLKAHLAEISPAAITVVDRSGQIIYANQRAEEILGLIRDEITDRTYNDPSWAITDLDGNPYPKEELPFSRIMATGEAVRNVRHAIESPDGRRVLLSINAAPLRSHSGEIEGMVAAIEDVTEPVRAAQALSASETFLQRTLDTLGAHIAILDGHGTIVAVNAPWRAFAEANGIARTTDWEGVDYLAVCDAAQDPSATAAARGIRAVIAGEEETFYLEYPCHGPTEECWFEMRVTRYDEPGQGRALVAHEDITERRRAMEEVRRGETRFSTIVYTSPLGVFIYELEGEDRLVLRGFNPAANRILGVDCKRFIGKTIEEAFPPLADTEVPERYRRAAALGEVWRTQQIEYQDEDIRGAYEVVAFQIRPGAMACMFSDITGRARAEAERREFEAKVQDAQKLESLGVMAGGIAHDFNNLLVGILGNADLARADLPAGSPAIESLQEIETAARRAADLCRQLLAYSGKGRFVIEQVDLSEVVQEMVQLLEVSTSKKAELHFDLAEDLPAIEADATQVRQVVMNLITNASEAIGDTEGVIRVRTGVMLCDHDALAATYLAEDLPAGEYVFLEVSDSGCGMDEESRRRVFEPFFTTKFAGRGLGMAAVLGIVRGHRAAIRVDSEPGRGSNFTVLFRARETPPSRQPSEGSRHRQEWQTSGTALLVDDEEAVRVVGRRMLRRLGFEVITASDGREAIALFRERAGTISCVLLDLTMPHLDGEETFRELRRIREDVPVILSSGFDEQETMNRFFGETNAGFLNKPYRLDDLAVRLHEVLGNQSGRARPSRS